MRRLLLALAALVLGGAGYQVALGVVAFSHGGPAAVGIAYALQVIPVALLTPFTSTLADRFPRRRLMVAIDLLRCTCTTAVAIAVAADAPLSLILLLGAPGAIASGAYAPASRALLPSLVAEPGELTAANAATSAVEHAGLLAGPALFGVLLLVSGPAVVFAIGAVSFFGSALLVARVRGEEHPAEAPGEAWEWRVEGIAGLRTVFTDPALRLLIGVYAAVAFVGGAIQVYVVVLAQDLTGLGDSGVGAIFAALGAGGLLGSVAAVALGERWRLVRVLAFGVSLVGAPLLVIGLVPGAPTALGGVAIVGFATVIADVSIITMLQRSVDENVLARVFGVLESVLVGMIGVGALAAPLLISRLDAEGALIATGLLLPTVVAIVWSRMHAMPTPGADHLSGVAALRGLPMFEPLSPPMIESLAAHLVEVNAADDEVVIRQGDRGSRFYVVGDGAVEVQVDGHVVGVLGAGDGFGEIALLRDVPRSATAIARGPTRLYGLDREIFLAAVTAHPVSAAAGEALAAARLGRAGRAPRVGLE